jgi:hypothetical protein
MLAINWQFFKCGAYTRESNAENSRRNQFCGTFFTKMNPDEATAEIRIFTPVKMQFGTSWDVMGIDE